ncbi:DUF4231 domain-containing protein [Alteromonas sp. a30]|uniref:DUF4231 domain-containing protein n=1 Tax=Alteromonas sp. a30 TaxID=2730917 RepID=UPI00228267D2|nr:DUF4231 domain-containing protein [Alteromonas sp. a30]MCY7297289.1 DUF4231 domain-containing protein [Alteromonas sp. a30]
MSTTMQNWTVEQYIQERVDPQIQLYEDKAQGNMRCYRRIKRYETYCAMLLPLLIVFWHYSPSHIIWIQTFISIDAILVAILSSLANLGHYLEDANQYQNIKNKLTYEKSSFLTKTAQYQINKSQDNTDGNLIFTQYIDRTEQILSS